MESIILLHYYVDPFNYMDKLWYRISRQIKMFPQICGDQ